MPFKPRFFTSIAAVLLPWRWRAFSSFSGFSFFSFFSCLSPQLVVGLGGCLLTGTRHGSMRQGRRLALPYCRRVIKYHGHIMDNKRKIDHLRKQPRTGTDQCPTATDSSAAQHSAAQQAQMSLQDAKRRSTSITTTTTAPHSTAPANTLNIHTYPLKNERF